MTFSREHDVCEVTLTLNNSRLFMETLRGSLLDLISTIKGIVHSKMKICSKCAHPQAIPIT